MVIPHTYRSALIWEFKQNLYSWVDQNLQECIVGFGYDMFQIIFMTQWSEILQWVCLHLLSNHSTLISVSCETVLEPCTFAAPCKYFMGDISYDFGSIWLDVI